MLTGYIVDNGPDPRVSWQTVFYIAAGIYLFGCAIYWLYASGEVQPWAKVAEEEDKARQAEEEAAQTRGLPEAKGYANQSLEMNEN